MAKVYNLMGNGANFQSEHKRAHQYFTKAWRLIENCQDGGDLKARICRDLGYNFCHQGNTFAGMRWYAVSLKHGRASGNQFEIATTLCAAGESYLNLGMYSKALSALNEALKIHKAHSIQPGLSIVLLTLARVHGTLQNPGIAQRCIRESLELSRKLGSERDEMFSVAHLGQYYSMTGKYDSAIKQYFEVAAWYERIGDRQRLAFTFRDIALVYRGKGEYGPAHEYINRADCILQTLRNSVGSAILGVERMHILIAQKRWKEAIEGAADCLEILASTGHGRSLLPLHQGLAQSYEETGDYKRSLFHYKRYISLERDMMSAEVRRKISALQIEAIMNERNAYQVTAQRLQSEAEARSKELASTTLRITHTNEFLDQLRDRLTELKHANGRTPSAIDGIIREINERTGRVDVWNTFEHQLQTLDTDFVHALTGTCSSLTPAEIRLCLLLRLNMSNKEIAALLNVSTRTLDAHRMSIRKKLGLEKRANLVVFLAGV